MQKVLAAIVIMFSANLFSQELTPAQSAALDKQVEIIKEWAKDNIVVSALKNYKAGDYSDLTNEVWKGLSVLDPKVKAFTKNEVATFLKNKKGEIVTEAFLNAKEGTKVAFLAKTTSWTHKGSAKHEDPMGGKAWKGKVEVDESTGAQQIQVSVPVYDGNAIIGSLVVGLSVSQLK